MAQLFIPDDYADLAAAVAVAVDGDEIIFRDGTYTGVNNTGLNVDVPGGPTASLVIRSEKNDPETVILDAETLRRVITYSNTGTLTLKGLTLRNGKLVGINDQGAGIHKANGSGLLNLENIIVDNCECTGSNSDGGGMYLNSGSVSFKNLLVKNCRAQEGGGIYWSDNVVNVSWRNTTIVDNEAFPSETGGGIYFEDINVGQDVDIYDSIIWDNNDTGNNGHQIFKAGVIHNVNLINSCIRNTPNDIVGAVVLGAGTITTNPRFETAGTRTNLLSQKAAGQVLDSPCWDTGSQSAAAADMDDKTTRTDAVEDQSTVDMGFHYFTGPPCLTGPCGAPGGLMSINNMLAQINCLLRNYYAGLIAGLDPNCIVRAIAVDEDGHIILGTLLEEWTTTWPVTMQDAVSVPLGATSALSAVLDLRRARGAAITSHVAFHALAAGDVVIRAYSSTDNVTYSTVPIAEMRAVCNPGNTEVVPMRIGAEFSYVKVTAENLDAAQAAVVTTIGEKKLTQETCD